MEQENIALSISNTESIIETKRTIYLFFKRLIDIVFGFVGIVLLIPLTIIVKLIYILTGDFHSIFYTQYRIGRNGKVFKIYKYRSMVLNADEILKNLLKDKKIAYEYKKNKKLNNDPRITKAGKIIRKLSLDEFPQFINIFIGNMSLIGNRPYLPREKNDMGIFYDNIISTKPGLTGYWQVSGRNNTSFRKRIKLENYYSSNYSFMLDIKIFFKTFKTLISRNGAK